MQDQGVNNNCISRYDLNLLVLRLSHPAKPDMVHLTACSENYYSVAYDWLRQYQLSVFGNLQMPISDAILTTLAKLRPTTATLRCLATQRAYAMHIGTKEAIIILLLAMQGFV